jgi:nucleoside-diphosphate-sugar epimerase
LDRGVGVTLVGRNDVDLAEAEAVRALLTTVRPDTIVHLAASLLRGESEQARLQQWRDTVQVGRNLLSLAAEAGTSRIVAAGSMDELGDHPGVLGTDLPPNPRTTYGLSKSLVFDIARFHAAMDGLSVDWFRPTTVYGPGQTGAMLIPTAFAAAASGKPAEFTDGHQERDFLFIDDLIEWLLAAIDMERPLTPGQLGVYHLGSGTSVSVRNVLALIASHFPGSDFRLGAVPRRPDEPALQYAEPYRSSGPTVPKWQPRTSLDEGLEMTARWWRSRT